MRRALPPEPHLDHLKKQAKDLLEAHHRGDPQAAERIRAVLPSFASMSDAEILRAPFALHDAQSAIGREYGYKSWTDLRAEVTRQRGNVFPSAFFRAMEPQLRAMWGTPMPDAVKEALKSAWSSDGAALEAPLPDKLPLIAVRNTLLVPGAVAPLMIGRPSSMAALEAAMRQSPPTVASFAQRDAATEDVRTEALHPVGCQVLVHALLPQDSGRAFVVLRGMRWIALEAVEPAASAPAYLTARVSPVDVDEEDQGEEVSALFTSLRERARQLAGAMPESSQLVPLIDAIEDPERLANLVVANLWCPVDDKARYAAEKTLPAKLRTAITLVDAVGKAQASAGR
jgi:Lon protease-like protein